MKFVGSMPKNYAMSGRKNVWSFLVLMPKSQVISGTREVQFIKLWISSSLVSVQSSMILKYLCWRIHIVSCATILNSRERSTYWLFSRCSHHMLWSRLSFFYSWAYFAPCNRSAIISSSWKPLFGPVSSFVVFLLFAFLWPSHLVMSFICICDDISAKVRRLSVFN